MTQSQITPQFRHGKVTLSNKASPFIDFFKQGTALNIRSLNETGHYLIIADKKPV